MRIYIYTSHHAWLVDIYEYMIMLSDHYLTTQKFKQKIKVWRQRWHLLWTTLYASTFAMDWWLCVSRWKVWANPQDLYVWYIYLHENPSKSTIHVGKYTSPMDPMGLGRAFWEFSQSWHTDDWNETLQGRTRSSTLLALRPRWKPGGGSKHGCGRRKGVTKRCWFHLPSVGWKSRYWLSRMFQTFLFSPRRNPETWGEGEAIVDSYCFNWVETIT